MGYTPPGKRYELDFTGTEYDGLEVTMRGLSTGEYLKIQKMLPKASTGDPEAAEALIGSYQKSILDWNVTDDMDEPVKPTNENVMDQDLAMTLFVINGWMSAVAGITPDLGKESTSGLSSEVADLPTVPL